MSITRFLPCVRWINATGFKTVIEQECSAGEDGRVGMYGTVQCGRGCECKCKCKCKTGTDTDYFMKIYR